MKKSYENGCFKGIDRRIMKHRLKYFGHGNRMSAERYPKIAFYGYVHGKRNKGRPKKRWLDNVKVDCDEMGLNLYEATSRTMDRGGWRASMNKLLLRANVSPRQ